MKKLFTLFLTLTTSIGMMYSETYSGTCGAQGDNLTWDLTDSVLIISGTGEMADYQILETPWNTIKEQIKSVIVEDGVTTVGNWAFYQCYGITSVTLPNGLTKIGENAFASCYLDSINLPNTIETIEFNAFANCWRLQSITIPDGVSTLEDGVFERCESLKSIYIGKNLSYINNRAIYECHSFEAFYISEENEYYSAVDGVLFNKDKTTLCIYPCAKTGDAYTIPQSVTEISSFAFEKVELKKIIIPEGVILFGEYAFHECRSLVDINLPSHLTEIADGLFDYCSKLPQINIPNTITKIGRDAFQGCDSLKQVIIPNGITSIGVYAFRDCSSLTTITLPESLTSLGSSAFLGCNALTSIYVEDNNQYYCDVDGVLFNRDTTTLIQYPASKGSVYIIPDGVKTIAFGAFYYYYHRLTEITIPASVTKLETFAFIGCTGLTFVKCKAITPPAMESNVFRFIDFSIPLYVPEESIEAYKAANGWKDFINILPIEEEPAPCLIASGTCGAEGDNLTWELSCDSILTISGTGEMVDWNYGEQNYAPWRDYSNFVVTVILPDGLTHIGHSAFFGCSKLQNINIPNTVTSVGEYAFVKSSNHLLPIINGIRYADTYLVGPINNNLSSYIIEEGTKWIGTKAFYTVAISSITIPNSVIGIGSGSFIYTGLTEITIPDSVETIGYSAFYDCNHLKDVIIGSGVKWIGHSAFSDCDSLSSITCKAVIPPVLEEARVFRYTSKTIPLYVPAESIDAYKAAEEWKEFINILPIEEDPAPCIIASGTCGAQGDNLTWEFSCDSILTISGIGEMCTFDTTPLPWRNYINDIEVVKIEEGVRTIGRLAFANCQNLASVSFSNTLRTIGAYSFANCTSLTSLSFPKSVIGIGLGAFDECTGLQTVYISDLKVWSQILFGRVESPHTNPLFYAHHLYLNGVEVKNLEIPDSISEISAYAFIGGTAFTTLTIPNDVAEIGDNAFSMCSGLTSITCYANTPPVLGKTVFKNVNTSVPLYVPCASINQYRQASQWRSFINIIPLDTIEMNLDLSVNDTLYGNVELLQKRYITCYKQEYVMRANAKEGYQFLQWSDGNTDNPRTVELTQDKSLVAEFEPIYMATDLAMIYINGLPVEGFEPYKYSYTFRFPAGTSETSLPTADNITWDLGDAYQTVSVSQTASTVVINVTSGRGFTKTYVLAFLIETPNQFTVTTRSNNDDWGVAIGGNTYNENSSVSIAALASEGFQFYHWNNSIKDNPYTFTLTQDTSFVAMFLPNTEEAIVSDVTSNSIHMEWEVKPWGNHGYWVWIYVDKDHKQWYCKMRFLANGMLDKFYWGPASHHYDASMPNHVTQQSLYRTPARYLETSTVISYNLTELDAATTYFYTIEGVDETEQVISALAGVFTTEETVPSIIEQSEAAPLTTTKIIKNGHLFILRANKTYTAQGHEVE